MAEFISAPLALAAEQFAKLPGIGIKTAQRLAYYMLNLPPHEVKEFADALVRARNGVQLCSCCQNFTDREVCEICSDEHALFSTMPRMPRTCPSMRFRRLMRAFISSGVRSLCLWQASH